LNCFTNGDVILIIWCSIVIRPSFDQSIMSLHPQTLTSTLLRQFGSPTKPVLNDDETVLNKR